VYFKYLLIGLSIAGLLFGCSSDEEDSPNHPQTESSQASLPDFSSISTSDVYVYECGDSLQFSAHVTSDSTWLFLPDTSLKVMPVPSGSGARYEGNAYLYWSKEQEAILQKPRGSFMTCQTVPKENSWQAAKLRGVDFRALGQEPGWHLEITKGKQVKYVGNYGQDTVYTSVPVPQIEQQRTVYRANTEDHKLKVEIIDESCTDIMSGFEFPTKVSVTIDGNLYHGCGRTLN
jgi:putative lipoprotein